MVPYVIIFYGVGFFVSSCFTVKIIICFECGVADAMGSFFLRSCLLVKDRVNCSAMSTHARVQEHATVIVYSGV